MRKRVSELNTWLWSKRGTLGRWVLGNIALIALIYISVSIFLSLAGFSNSQKEIHSVENSAGLHEIVVRSNHTTYNRGFTIIGNDVQAVVKKCGDINDLNQDVVDLSDQSYEVNLAFDEVGTGNEYEAKFIDCLGDERTDIGKVQYGIIYDISDVRFIDKPGNHWYYFSSEESFSLIIDSADVNIYYISTDFRLLAAVVLAVIINAFVLSMYWELSRVETAMDYKR